MLAMGCGEAPEAPGLSMAPDREFSDFQRVYPTLMRDCGFHTCHGSDERFFRIYGPGRVRLDSDSLPYDIISGDEWSASVVIARSMVDPDNPEDSPLLRKPLAVEAGGAPHGGVDRFGRDIYRTANDEGYLAIARFVFAIPPDDEEEEE